ncbi:hypothetical protein KUL42_40480 [Alteromonas sp. KUL42]|uniref:calcium-binding protein n=1 Tax=Alteromonas sp. KUL42 TaxID=2480797 RepID=UPI0010FFAD1E|nr:calcium-binding protein [Alteromonas sp. KUL42]GEA09287.1 hypothetical protein KUL42_40480 [Alteromonas sp. KUL42]
MMKRLEKVFFVLCAVATVQAIAIAEAQATPSAALIQKLDTNKDQLISLKEAIRHVELLRNFGLIDENEDGMLSQDELAKSSLTPGNDKSVKSD